MHCSAISAPRFGAALVIKKVTIPDLPSKPNRREKRFKPWALKYIVKTHLRKRGPLRDFHFEQITGGKRNEKRITLLIKDSPETATLIELTGPTAKAYVSVLARRLKPIGKIKKLKSQLLGVLTGNSQLNKKAQKILLRLASHEYQHVALKTALERGTNPELDCPKKEQNEPILVIDETQTACHPTKSYASRSGQPYLDKFSAFLADA